MGKIKKLWSKIYVPVIAVSVIVVLFSLVALNQKINFVLGNELIVYLLPHEKSLSIYYGQKEKVDFDISISNFGYCKTSCEYSFNDRSANKAIESGNFGISGKEHVNKNYELSVLRLGSGQEVYSFDLKCKNKKSLFCLTDGSEVYRSSLVTVNYDLTPGEKSLKDELKLEVGEFLEILKETDVSRLSLDEKFYEAAFKVNLNGVVGQKIRIDNSIDSLRLEAENLKALWSEEEYKKLNETFDRSLYQKAGEISVWIKNLDSSVDSLTKLHNSLLKNLSRNSEDLNGLLMVSELNNDIGGTARINSVIENFNSISSSITNNTFDSYETIISSIGNLSGEKSSGANKDYPKSLESFSRLSYSLKKENEFLCSLNKCKKTIPLAQALAELDEYSKQYPSSQKISLLCDQMNQLGEDFSEIRNDTLKYIAQNNIIFENMSIVSQDAKLFLESKIIEANNSILDEVQDTDFGIIKPELKEIIFKNFPKNHTLVPIISSDYKTELFALENLQMSPVSNELLKSCAKIKSQKSVGNFDFSPVLLANNYTATSSLDTSLSENKPLCCLFSDCSPCCNDETCKNDPSTYPVILLHGHSFVKDNSPEFSLDAFNLMQSRLQEDGYLNAGIVSLYSKNEPGEPGVWGLSGKPVTVKASYYFDAFKKDDKYIVVPTKSENIDTYAIRLKDIISIVKERTGKPKVSIIAHSMGGLVARRYIQIFGEDGVDKLIMIAVPNKGVVGSVSDVCGIIGENRECIDMQENSVFLRKLNDAAKQPKNAKMFNIITQGCKMALGNGDGVVLAKNEKIDGAKEFFVDGTCPSTFGSYLHTDVLDIEKYPEAYEIVKGILKE
ncbi:MAG TPA: alpha/beta hydrolase [Candidatus Nanoarchaeia archaeon]|nr:alpha/beta hydrolase [Candidatus Nanoarchaeia archaeon]